MARLTQAEKNEAYRNERRKLLQNVRRMKKRRYDVSDIKIPEIPTDRKIRQSDINALKKLNASRYDKATFKTVIWARNEHGEKGIVWKTFKGKKAQVMVRRKGSEKAVTTKRLKEKIRREYPGATKEEINWRLERQRKQADEEWRQERARIFEQVEEELAEWRESTFEGEEHSSDAVFNPNTGEWVEPSLTVDTDAYDYYQDRETGEIIELPKGSKNPNPNTFMRTLPQRESGEKMYDNALSQLSIYEEYMGDPKHGRDKKHDETTRENATKIRELLEKLHAENPDALYKALETIGEPLLATDIKYFKGGYNNMAFQIAQALSYNGYDITPSEYDEGDYDEGNYEY